MRRLASVALIVLASCGSAWSAEQQEMSVAALPPVVVKTVPQAGDTQVDPSITEISGTFSKKMTTGKNYSWAGAEESWVAGQPRWLADGKTCSLPVKLEPGENLRGLAQFAQFPQLQGLAGAIGDPLLARLRDGKEQEDSIIAG